MLEHMLVLVAHRLHMIGQSTCAAPSASEDAARYVQIPARTSCAVSAEGTMQDPADLAVQCHPYSYNYRLGACKISLRNDAY